MVVQVPAAVKVLVVAQVPVAVMALAELQAPAGVQAPDSGQGHPV